MVPKIILISECFDNIPLDKECQVQASSQLDLDYGPYNAISDTKGKTETTVDGYKLPYFAVYWKGRR